MKGTVEHSLEGVTLMDNFQWVYDDNMALLFRESRLVDPEKPPTLGDAVASVKRVGFGTYLSEWLSYPKLPSKELMPCNDMTDAILQAQAFYVQKLEDEKARIGTQLLLLANASIE